MGSARIFKSEKERMGSSKRVYIQSSEKDGSECADGEAVVSFDGNDKIKWHQFTIDKNQISC